MKAGRKEGQKKKKKEKGSTEEWREIKIEGNGWMDARTRKDR